MVDGLVQNEGPAVQALAVASQNLPDTQVVQASAAVAKAQSVGPWVQTLSFTK